MARASVHRWLHPARFAALPVLLCTVTARAEQIRLEYVPAKGCPSEKMLHHAITAQWKEDPFSPDAKAKVRVVIERVNGEFEATYTITDSDGKETAPRTMPRYVSCAVAVTDVGLSLSTLLPPLITAPTPPRKSPPDDPRPWTPPPKLALGPDRFPAPAMVPGLVPVHVEEPPPRKSVFSWQFDVGILGSFGTAPWPAFGLAFHMGPRWSFVSLNLGIRGELPASNTTEPTKITVSRIMLEGLPCVHVDPYFFGCGLVQIGQLTESSQKPDLPPVTQKIASIGVRIGHDFALGGPFPAGMSFYVHGDVARALQATTFALLPPFWWTAPHVQWTVGVGLRFAPP